MLVRSQLNGHHVLQLVLIPLFLLALFNISYFIQKNVGQASSIMLLNSLVNKVTANSQSILKFIALNEILIFPALIMMLFSGKCNLLSPFIYYRLVLISVVEKMKHVIYSSNKPVSGKSFVCMVQNSCNQPMKIREDVKHFDF